MGSELKHVFTPITIKGVEFKNRIESAPMSPKLTTLDGFITTEFLEFFRPIARGGAGIVTIGNSSIDLTESKDETRHADLGNDDAVLGLSRFADMCTDYGAIPSIEVNHSGRDAMPEFTRRAPYGPSACYTEAELARAKAEGFEPVRVIEMDREKIQETVEKYARAVLRCKKAGFPMVLLHGAHSSLLAQFVSPLTNQRTDEYGGSLENRARFVLEVLDRTRKLVGKDFIIEYRISATEFAEGGMGVEETLEFAKMIQEQIDILHVSAGMRCTAASIQHFMQPMYLPREYNVHFAEQFRKELKVPITAVGSIMNVRRAEEILANGLADFVALGRPFLADPELVRKGAKGQDDEVCPCIRCNYHGRVVAGKGIGCAVNPICGREMQFPRGVQPAPTKKKVLVVGGGPGGMQAARTAAERGHDVTLYERGDRLGGNMIHAAALDYKFDVREYMEWAIRQTEKCGARIVLNTEADVALIEKEAPDALILAVGAEPFFPPVPGAELPHVAWAPMADHGLIDVAHNVVIVGGGVVGYESAVALGRSGHDVTIIEMLPDASGLKSIGAARFTLMQQAADAGVKVLFGKRLEEIKTDSVCFSDVKSGQRDSLPCGTVLMAAGLRPRKAMVEKLRHTVCEPDVYIVGDGKRADNIAWAVNSAFTAAAEL